jgi:hypothetical protein
MTVYKNILKRADSIVNERSEEKQREYGNFTDSMESAARIYDVLVSERMHPAEKMYWAMIALKISRERHKHKQDNLLDIAAYVGALDNYHQEKQNEKR